MCTVLGQGSFCVTTDNLIDLIAYGFAFLAFLIGMLQYGTDQEWKRKEFVAAAWEKVKASPLSANAMTMLDYSLRWIHLNADKPNAVPVYARISWGWCAAALIPHTIDDPPEYGRAGALVRDAFDDFLTNLDIINGMIKAKLLSQGDVKIYLGYWAEKIVEPRRITETELAEGRKAVREWLATRRPLDEYLKEHAAQRKTIHQFFKRAVTRSLYLHCRAYGFKDVLDLCRKLNCTTADSGSTSDDPYNSLLGEVQEECKSRLWDSVIEQARRESDDKAAQYEREEKQRAAAAGGL
jgi:hypothetical protein